jgi:hypothetical protein
MSNFPQILDDRPFDINDGEYYFIMIDNNYVFTKKDRGAPVISSFFKEAKIYKDLKVVQKTVLELFSTNEAHRNRNIDILQVKTIFEPRYVVDYSVDRWGGNKNIDILQVKTIFEPRYVVDYSVDRWGGKTKLRCFVDWFVIGEDSDNTYLDYDEAIKQLEKNKRELIEFYYTEILNIRNFTLKKI